MFNPTITFAISPVSQQYLSQIFWANAMHKQKLIKAQNRLRNSSNDVRRNERKKKPDSITFRFRIDWVARFSFSSDNREIPVKNVGAMTRPDSKS